MQTVTLSPATKPLFQVQPQHSHSRLSLRRVLYARFLRWLDKASFRDIYTRFLGFIAVLLAIAIVTVPQFAIGMLSSSTKPVACLGIITAFVYARSISKLSRRVTRTRGGNQHTYHGLPVDEIASYLCDKQRFTREDAMQVLGMSQPKYQKIAEELSKHKVLIRGECNARVLNTMTREQLIRQLRDGFPLVYDEIRSEWVERDGSFHRWILSREHDEQKQQKQIERLDRRKKKLQQEVGSLGFIRREIMA